MVPTNWGVHVSLRTGESVYLMQPSKSDAEDVIEKWLLCLRDGQPLITFPTV